MQLMNLYGAFVPNFELVFVDPFPDKMSLQRCIDSAKSDIVPTERGFWIK